MSRPSSFPRSIGRVLVTVAAVLAAVVLGIVVSPSPDRTIAAEGQPLGAGGEYQGVTPTRIYDSRFPAEAQGQPGPLLMSASETNRTIDIEVTGNGVLPEFVDDDNDGQDDNVLAVVVNFTVINPTAVGFLRAYGTDAPEGTTSVVNFFAGSVLPNTAVIRPGTDGKMSMRLVSPTGPGTAQVAVDITGWFSTSQYDERGDRVIAIDPIRVYDSDFEQFGATTLKGRSQVRVPIRGAAEVSAPGTPVVPAGADVVGVIANITGVNAFPGSQATFISALPERQPSGTTPSTSTVNLIPGQIRPNMAILPLGADGSIHLFNLTGEVRMVVDVVAYLLADTDEDTRAGRVVPLVAPFRAFDTREGEFGNQPLGPAEAEDFSFESFIADVKIDGDPVGAQSALIGNLTATGLQRQYPAEPAATFLTGFPTPSSGQSVPLVSNINITENDTVPNLSLLPYGARPAPVGDGRCEEAHCIRFYNRAGYLDYLLDVYAVILEDG